MTSWLFGISPRGGFRCTVVSVTCSKACSCQQTSRRQRAKWECLHLDSRLTFKCYGAAVCLWIILVPHCAQAQVVYDLSKLISSSDLVAVAQVANVQQTSSGTVGVPGAKTPIPAHFRIVSLRLQSFLKGKAPPSDVKVPYTILYSPAGWSGGVPQGYTITDTLVPNSIRLVFLRSRGDHYEFTNGSYLSVVCSPESRSEGFSRTY